MHVSSQFYSSTQHPVTNHSFRSDEKYQ